MKSRLLVLSELYYPDDTATGFLLTRIAEGLASSFDVHVLSGYGGKRARGEQLPSREIRGGVAIERCAGTSLNKNVLLLRFLNLATISLSLFFRSLIKVRQGDIVLVVTNPPTLPFLAVMAARLRRGKCVILVHDVYPEVLIAAGLLSRGSALASLLSRFNGWVYRSADHVVTIGRDMNRLVEAKLGDDLKRMTCIPNWADLDMVSPEPRSVNPLLEQLKLKGKFVVQYSGNMGRTHGLETLLRAAAHLKDVADLHFLLIGSGAKQRYVESTLQSMQLNNVTHLPPQPREKLSQTLNACDVAIVAFLPGLAGVSVPSRMYNIMAAGKPIIAVTDADSELAMVVKEEEIGWVVPPGDEPALCAVLRTIIANPEIAASMQTRATVAASKYSLEKALTSYRAVLASVQSRH